MAEKPRVKAPKQRTTTPGGNTGHRRTWVVAAAAVGVLLGLVAVGYCFAKSAKIAVARLAEGGEDSAFYDAKLKTAAFYFDRILPQATACFLAIKSGKASMMALGEEAF